MACVAIGAKDHGRSSALMSCFGDMDYHTKGFRSKEWTTRKSRCVTSKIHNDSCMKTVLPSDQTACDMCVCDLTEKVLHACYSKCSSCQYTEFN